MGWRGSGLPVHHPVSSPAWGLYQYLHHTNFLLGSVAGVVMKGRVVGGEERFVEGWRCVVGQGKDAGEDGRKFGRGRAVGNEEDREDGE